MLITIKDPEPQKDFFTFFPEHVPSTGEGVTKPAGKHAGAIIDAITSPEFIKAVEGDVFREWVAEKKQEMREAGAYGRHTRALGMMPGSEWKCEGFMQGWLFQWLSHLDPEIFQNDELMDKILRRIGGKVDERMPK